MVESGRFSFLIAHKDEFYAKVRPEYRALAERLNRIEWDEFEPLRMNSYEAKLLVANLSDDALVKFYEMCAKQVRSLGEYEIPRDYNEAIERQIAPLLAERLKAYVEAETECRT